MAAECPFDLALVQGLVYATQREFCGNCTNRVSGFAYDNTLLLPLSRRSVACSVAMFRCVCPLNNSSDAADRLMKVRTGDKVRTKTRVERESGQDDTIREAGVRSGQGVCQARAERVAGVDDLLWLVADTRERAIARHLGDLG